MQIGIESSLTEEQHKSLYGSTQLPYTVITVMKIPIIQCKLYTPKLDFIDCKKLNCHYMKSSGLITVLFPTPKNKRLCCKL